MKANAVVFTAVKQVQFQQIDVPEPGEKDVVIDVDYSWISNGTESSFLYGERISGEQATKPGDLLPFPQVAGYQKVGRVRAVGFAVLHVQPGDYVFASISAVNGMKFNYGGHVSPAVTPMDQVWKLPDHADPIAFSGSVLTQVGYNCGSRPPVAKGDHAVVIGDGMVGQWAAQTLAHRGAKVTVLGRHDKRLAMLPASIQTLNLRTQSLDQWLSMNHNIAIVVDSVGSMATFRSLMPAMRLNSHLVSAGFLGEEGLVDIQELRPQEITLHCPSGWTHERMNETIAGIQSRWLQTKPLITHLFPVAKAEEAWQLIMNRSDEYLGVILDWRKSSQ